MKKFLLYIIGFVLVAGCNFGDSVTIKGELQGFDEGELYFYRPFDNNSSVDTVEVRRGRFTYNTSVENETPIILQFSSSAELPLFAKGGSSISIKGNVTDLQNIKIKGGTANKEMSSFRSELNKAPGKTSQIVEEFIKGHPESIVSTYLLYKYYVQVNPVNLTGLKRLLAILEKGQPDGLYLKQLKGQLKEYQLGQAGSKMPSFKLKTTGNKFITNNNYKGNYYLVLFGASWSSSSSSYMYSLTSLNENGRKIPIIYVSLDVNTTVYPTLQGLNMTFVNEPLAWESTFVKGCHVVNIPDNILVNPQGQIIARGLSVDQLKNRINALAL